MARKKRDTSISWHSNPRVLAFQEEMQAWLEKNVLTEDMFWRTADEHYGEELGSFPLPHYLVLIAEGDLYDVLWDNPGVQMLRREFDEIVKRHGLRMDHEDNVTVCFMGKIAD
jgi:hypothetical protein